MSAKLQAIEGNVAETVPRTLRQIGGSVDESLTHWQDCSTCCGTGDFPEDRNVPCHACRGAGRVKWRAHGDPTYVADIDHCHTCSDLTSLIEGACERCRVGRHVRECGCDAWADAERRLGQRRIVCAKCRDTHTIPAPEDSSCLFWMCTDCPTPCSECRRGAYCARTPCGCSCHAERTRKA